MEISRTDRSRFLLTLLSVAVIALIGLIDHLSGTEVSLSVLYVGPVVLLTMVGGIRIGLAASLVCAVVSLGMDLNWGASARAQIVNAVVRGSVLATVAVLYGKLVNLNKHLRELVDEGIAQQGAILQTAPDGFWLTDLHGRLLEVNEAYCAMSGYSRRELLTLRVADLEADESAEEVDRHIQRTLASGDDRFESRHRRKDGSVFPVEISLQYRARDGGSEVVFIRDISARRHAEQLAQAREVLLETTLSSTIDGILVVDLNGKTLLTNTRFAELWQLPSTVLETENDQAMLDHVLNKLVDPDAFLRKVKSLYASESIDHDELLFKDGRIFERNSLPLNSNGTHIGRVWTFRDITARKQAEEALAGVRRLLAETGKIGRVGGWEIDIDTGRQVWTEETYRIHEVDFSYQPTVESGLAFYEGESQAIITAAVQRAVEHGEPFNLELAIITARGKRRLVHAIGHPDLPTRKVVGFFQDITDRKQAEAAIRASLREKEALLKEVHHRVKNNLQVITSLLRLEGARNAHPGTRSVLEEMQGRIRSMAMLHEALYHSGTVAGADLGEYLTQLAREAFLAHNTSPSAVHLRLDMGSVHAEIDQALPCGMIVNELLANALEHGFPDGRHGDVLVELHTEDEGHRLRLRVSDTGVGLPADFATSPKTTLGLQLVSDLTGQLGGTLEIGPGPAAMFTVTFPVRPTPEHAGQHA